MSAHDKTLSGLLGGDTSEIKALDDGAKQRLIKDLESAKVAHEKHLKQAMDNAVGQLPMLLRLPVKKLFGI
jgi:hypothetical protein